MRIEHRHMPMELVRHVWPSTLAGALAGVVAAMALLATDAPLRELVLHADGGRMGFCLMVGGFVLTFASAAMGHAIMMIGQNED